MSCSMLNKDLKDIFKRPKSSHNIRVEKCVGWEHSRFIIAEENISELEDIAI